MSPAHAVAPMVWPAEAIWEAVSPHLPDFTVEVLPEIDSTNAELMRRARVGHTAPVLLVAERQTAGRGRLGRQWLSGAEDSAPGTPNAPAPALPALTCSFALTMSPPDWSGLSLAVGLSVADSLHPDIRLKWPNDLWLTGDPAGPAGGDRKLGGILIETTAVGDQRVVVVGVGLNIAPRSAAGLSLPPACLGELLPGATAASALGQLAAPLVQTLLRFDRVGFAPFRSGFEARDALRGRRVRVMGGTDAALDGLACGVGPLGALLVRTDAGLQEVTSAEVSVRPA